MMRTDIELTLKGNTEGAVSGGANNINVQRGTSGTGDGTVDGSKEGCGGNMSDDISGDSARLPSSMVNSSMGNLLDSARKVLPARGGALSEPLIQPISGNQQTRKQTGDNIRGAQGKPCSGHTVTVTVATGNVGKPHQAMGNTIYDLPPTGSDGKTHNAMGNITGKPHNAVGHIRKTHNAMGKNIYKGPAIPR